MLWYYLKMPCSVYLSYNLLGTIGPPKYTKYTLVNLGDSQQNTKIHAPAV